MTTRTLKSKLDRLSALQQEIDTLTAEAEALKDQIKKELEARNLDELEAGDHVVRWKPVTSNRFDAKAFKESHSKLYQQFAVPTTSRRFTLASA